MEPPSQGLREHVQRAFAEWALADPGEPLHEEWLEELLALIGSEMRSAAEADEIRDSQMSEEQAQEEMGNIDAWVGLMSHAVARTYAPSSPWFPRRFAGWDAKVTKRLEDMVGTLRTRLARVAKALGAVHFSISVSFPWGVSVGMSF